MEECVISHSIAKNAIEWGTRHSARFNVYARAPILTLDGGLKDRARELKLDVLEAGIQ